MYAGPEPESVPLHSCEIETPDGMVNAVVHPLSADEPASTTTSPWNRPDQEFTSR